jgi:DNA-binding transcriptional LysR family regulator
MIDLNEIRLFIKIVDLGSFINVSKQQGIPSTTISRKILQLEKSLGVRLLNRSTRKLTLTEQGKIFYEHVNEHIAKLEEAKGVITESQQEPIGLIRLTAPVDFCVHFLQPIISRFLSNYPKINIEINVSDETLDLIENRIDVAFRVGILEDSNLIAKHLSKSEVVCCASSNYLAQYGMPESLEALKDHNCILMGNTLNNQSWHFKKGNELSKVSVTGRYAANSMTLMIESALSGLGIALIPIPLVKTQIEKGSLKILFKNYTIPSGDLFILYQSHRYLSKSTRLFIDFVSDEMQPILETINDIKNE